MDNLDKKPILTDSYLLKPECISSEYETNHYFPFKNESLKFISTTQNVLGGLYFSLDSDHYISCINGDVLFVIIDLKIDSPTYLKSSLLKLTSKEPCYIFIPKLHAYGYFSIKNSLLFISNYTNDHLGLNILDESLNLKFSNFIMSDKDRKNPSLNEIRSLLNTSYTNGLNQFDKTVLITGGAGFIGSHVAILLTKRYPNYKVIVLDKLEECSNINNLNEIRNLKNFLFIKGDICDFEANKKIFQKYKFDYVIHFAAQTHVDISLIEPLIFTKTNVLGTHNLLECSRLNGIEKFVHVSTDEVYGTTDKIPNINQPLEPTNPYACSKLAAENIIKAYQKCYKIPIVITRGNNAYGPHQYVEKVIPKFINRLLENKKCCIHKNCYDSERDFMYVTDMAEAFDLVLHKGVPGEFYNIGASNSVNIVELAKKLIVLMGKAKEGEENEYIEVVKGRLLNDERYRIDSSKLIELGWEQKISFDDGLVRTIEWYKANQNYWDKWDIVIDQFCDKLN
ncbi:unnamed protein product [Brachionus calyciflorus]|uniref:dTDP-D-glucose 4,6-dehydratase n=1 Tax=Brachionus calyciflorus TaxID=104777 RepID=A0A814Q9T4_9BILA|nr:unnamed protein product [Brachionus calyciflorus]